MKMGSGLEGLLNLLVGKESYKGDDDDMRACPEDMVGKTIASVNMQFDYMRISFTDGSSISALIGMDGDELCITFNTKEENDKLDRDMKESIRKYHEERGTDGTN